MNELEQVLAGDSAHTPPAEILDGLEAEAAHRVIPGAPRSIYEELWHIAFWQQITLDWVRGIETPYPVHASAGFPAAADAAREPWELLCQRFFATNREAAAAALDLGRLGAEVRCLSRPGMPARVMTVREQLESLGAHNAYHFGRIVLLRQLQGLWPPPSGGFSW
ncbi:MAG: DinB family protein [Terracidiphilus sp.]|nr:DinB family protein [Terracidiphilus sp.]